LSTLPDQLTAVGVTRLQNGLGAVHALSHALGGSQSRVFITARSNAILLPPVLRFNAGDVGDNT
jgi:alcohol dehydrogenase class IV